MSSLGELFSSRLAKLEADSEASLAASIRKEVDFLRSKITRYIRKGNLLKPLTIPRNFYPKSIILIASELEPQGLVLSYSKNYYEDGNALISFSLERKNDKS